MNNPALPNSCATVGALRLMKNGVSKLSRAAKEKALSAKQKVRGFFQPRKRQIHGVELTAEGDQDNHVADSELEVANGHIKIDIHPFTNSFSDAAAVSNDAGPRRVAPNAVAGDDAPNAAAVVNDAGPRRVAPNAVAGNDAPNAAAVGNDAGSRRVDPHAAVVAPNAVGNDAGARRVDPHAAVDAPNGATVGNDAPDAAASYDAGEQDVLTVFVDALWDKCCLIFSMEPEQLGRALGVTAFATMHMSVLSVFIKPAAGPIFGVHIHAYYIILGGTFIFAVAETVTAILVFNSHGAPGLLFFGRSILCVGVVLLAFLTPHVLVGSGKV